MASSALHRIDVFDRDRAAVAIVGHQDREADRGLRRRHRQDEQREDLAGEVVQDRTRRPRG